MCINGAHANDVNSLCITPDCKHLVSASSDGTAKVWELPRCRLAQTVHHHRAIVVTAECFDNNLVASGGCDRAVRLWDLHTGMQHSTMRGHTNNVSLSVLRSRALFLYLSLSASVCLCLPLSASLSLCMRVVSVCLSFCGVPVHATLCSAQTQRSLWLSTPTWLRILRFLRDVVSCNSPPARRSALCPLSDSQCACTPTSLPC